MPNHCSNQVTVSGDADQLTAFLLAAKSGNEDLSFDNLFPCPQSLKDAASGSDEIYYDIVYGDLSKLAGYGWIPDEIKGDRNALLTFVANRQGYHAGKGIGIADLMKYNLETYGAKNWYDWCINNWGTKWGVYDSSGGRSEDYLTPTLVYNFTTAWGPATEGFVKISENFPGLSFDMEYFEPGMCFCGRVIIQDGGIIEDDYREFTGEGGLEEVANDDSLPFCSAEAQVWVEMNNEDEVA
jgi:hypothetical protein